MEAFSALLAFCEGNPSVTGGIPSQKASNATYNVSFDVSLNKVLNNNPMASDSRRHDALCDVTVGSEMKL